MSGSVRLILILLAVVFGSYLAIKVVTAVVGFVIGKVLAFLLPALVIAAIAVILYAVVSRKALGPGGRRILP